MYIILRLSSRALRWPTTTLHVDLNKPLNCDCFPVGLLPCYLLKESGILHVFKDAAARHGVPAADRRSRIGIREERMDY
jgi:hypothetical protein